MTIGNIPVGEEQLIDGTFVNGITQGHNLVFKNGIAAAGTTQAGATQLPDRVAVMMIDTAGASTDGVALPPALAGSGHFLFLYNNTSQNCVVYPTVANNAVTGIQDTINSSTSFALNAHVAGIFFCGENGIWAAK